MLVIENWIGKNFPHLMEKRLKRGRNVTKSLYNISFSRLMRRETLNI
jgi:hypothetical protein